MIYRRKRVLLSEIERQCRFALMAYDDASAALRRRDAERVWYALQGLLTASAHLRRLLARAADLRAAIGLPDDSPLNERSLEPMADLVPAWESWNSLQASEPSRLSSIGRDARAGAAGEAAAGCPVRSFDPETGTLTLFGKVLELSPLLAAIAEIAHRAETALEHRRQLV